MIIKYNVINMKIKKRDVMILTGLLIAIPLAIEAMILWIKNGIEPIAVAVVIVSLVMMMIALVLHVANMIGKES